MVCPVCRCPGAPCVLLLPSHEIPKVFNVVLDEDCFMRMFIPCNVRASLAAYIQEHRIVAKTLDYKRIEPALLIFDSRSYAEVFKHQANYSKLCGSAWFEFTHDYALRAGDRVVFTLDNSVFDVKVDTYRDGERLLPLHCAALDTSYFALLSCLGACTSTNMTIACLYVVFSVHQVFCIASHTFMC